MNGTAKEEPTRCGRLAAPTDVIEKLDKLAIEVNKLLRDAEKFNDRSNEP